MVRRVLVTCAGLAALAAIGCGSTARKPLVHIEPTYSHVRADWGNEPVSTPQVAIGPIGEVSASTR